MYKNKEANFIWGKMQFSTPEKVANTAYKMLNAVQHLPSEEQILGIGALLLIFCHRYGFENFGDVLGQTHNYIFTPNIRPEFKGLMRFFKEIYS